MAHLSGDAIDRWYFIEAMTEASRFWHKECIKAELLREYFKVEPEKAPPRKDT